MLVERVIYLYVEKGNRECEEAAKLLNEANFRYTEVEACPGGLLLAYGASDVPLAVVPGPAIWGEDLILIGIEQIRKFVEGEYPSIFYSGLKRSDAREKRKRVDGYVQKTIQ